MSIAQAQNMLAEIWNDIQRAEQKRKLIDAQTNPDKYRLDRTMNGHAGYIYYHGGWIKTARRHEKHVFCRSVNRNIGGNYLIWQEVSTYTPKGKWKQTERISFSYSDSKKDATETAKRKRDSWKKKHPEHSEY
jgi:hypothetical protein